MCRYWAHDAKSSKPFCFLCKRPFSHQSSPYSPPPLAHARALFHASLLSEEFEYLQARYLNLQLA